jgi:hypothetical protein
MGDVLLAVAAGMSGFAASYPATGTPLIPFAAGSYPASKLSRRVDSNH